MIDEFLAIFQIEGENYLGICLRLKAITIVGQTFPMFTEIINFAVEEDSYLAIGRPEGLLAAIGKIDQGKPHHASRTALERESTLAIRPPVGHTLEHRGYASSSCRLRLAAIPYSCNTTHS